MTKSKFKLQTWLSLAYVVIDLIIFASAAFAQQGSVYSKASQPWYQQGKISGGISVTGSSAATALPVAGFTAWVCNTGSNDAYLAFGLTNAIVATTSGATNSSWLKAGTCGNYDLFPPFAAARNGFVAAITASSTTTLTVETGLGNGPQQVAVSGGGGGGSVTLAAGSVAAGAYSAGALVDGADATEGLTTDAAAATGGTGTLSAKLRQISSQIGTPAQANGAVGASENHIGEVGGNLLPITDLLTTTAATITTGQSIGGIQTLANAVRVSAALGSSGTSGYIQSLLVTFTDAVGSGPLDVYFYNATVTTGSNCQNATAFVLQDADRGKVVGIAHVTDFTASNTATAAQANNLAIPYGLASSTSLFACVVARASFVISGTANATLKVNVVRN